MLALNSNIADAHSGLGVVLTNQGKLNEALACFERALACDPRHADAHLNRAIIWLMRGHWLAAWPEYEWRWQTKTVPRLRFDKPRWDGSPLAGKTILLASEQGLGDALQFLRYVPFVQERGGKVIVQCQPALQRLLASCLGQEMVSVGGAELPKFDVYAPLMSLPGIFGTTPVNVPARVQYLRADERLAEHWKNELSALEGFKIGVAWQGSPKNRNDRRRSFPLASLAPVAAVPGVQLVSLQKGPGRGTDSGSGKRGSRYRSREPARRIKWRFHGHGGRNDESRSGDYRRYRRGPLGRRTWSSNLARTAIRAGLALVVAARGHSLVPYHAALSPDAAGKLARRVRRHGEEAAEHGGNTPLTFECESQTQRARRLPFDPAHCSLHTAH